MKLAILGGDDDVLRLVRYLAEEDAHQVVAVCASKAWRERLTPSVHGAVWNDDWESLIASNEVDAVVIGRDHEPFDGGECLRKLVQASVPLLVTHPVGDPLLALELDMIRAERNSQIVIQFSGCRHPALAQLRGWIESPSESPIGAIDQVVLERALPRRERADVIFQLARDTEYVRSLLGSVSKVNAMGPAADSEVWNNLSVQLAGNGPVLARWSVEPTTGTTHAKLTLIGANGRATLELPDDDAAWSLEVKGVEGAVTRATWADWNAPATALNMLEAALGGAEPTPSWPAVCRDLEVADTVELSLRRGRMIELHHSTVTEEDTFKGIMSAAGCLMLMLIPLVLVAAAMFDGIQSTREDRAAKVVAVDPNGSSSAMTAETQRGGESPARPIWIYVVIVPVLLFLGLQGLRLVFPSRRPRLRET